MPDEMHELHSANNPDGPPVLFIAHVDWLAAQSPTTIEEWQANRPPPPPDPPPYIPPPALDVRQSVQVAVDAGAGSDFNAATAADARLATEQAGIVWNFTTWQDALDEIQNTGQLGGVSVN